MSENEDVDTTYTLDVNGKRYALNEDFREGIQRRARGEYRGNHLFSCWWKVASRDDYTDEEWAENNHSEGDPTLVIETEGPMVPWDRLDELEIEMEDISQPPEADYHEDDGDTTEHDSGNGMKTLPPEDAIPEDEQEEQELGRTYFPLTPRSFEEVPQPDGDEPDKIPPKPMEMGDDPSLIWWVPKHPDVEERWGAGEAVVPTFSWVEWNVQARADEIRRKTPGEIKNEKLNSNGPVSDVKPNSHDHFESLCKIHDCEKVGEYTVSQSTPEGESGQVKRKGKKQFEDGKYGGDNFHV